MKRSRTMRTRLTLLYAGPFLLSGAVLLSLQFTQGGQTRPAGVDGGPGPTAPAERDLSALLTASALSLAAMAVVSIVLGWLIAGRYLRPLRAITATARDISASNLHRRLGPTGRGDEFTELAETLDDLFARLQAAFESQRHFVANAAHELRTPLTAERTLLQVALADPDASAETLRSACRDVLALGVAQERLVDSLLTLASSEQGLDRRDPFDLADIAAAALSTRREEAHRRGISLDAAFATAPAAGNPSLVESLVTNLIDNAVRHNAPGGTVEVVTTTIQGRASITVRNTGPKVPPTEVERLFQPFQRLGPQRLRHADGHGLGLAIVHAIANAHGATVTSRARPEGGLDIEVSFARRVPCPSRPSPARPRDR